MLCAKNNKPTISEGLTIHIFTNAMIEFHMKINLKDMMSYSNNLLNVYELKANTMTASCFERVSSDQAGTIVYTYIQKPMFKVPYMSMMC